ncbi:DUF1573 domain-containing protein [Aurantibacter sp.]|uniref:DUF1573 domain-containing protein n=1 Tax=Aurantibacter sp. TaxID=2807103 RepID=UPI0035C7C13F
MKNVVLENKKTVKTSILSLMLLLALSITSFSFAQNPDNAKALGVLTFKTNIIDYGIVEKGTDKLRVFTFTNTGKAPILITKVKTSCGCTVPNYPKKPILPGESASIDITYDTNRMGQFKKTITVMSNAEEALKQLTIKGNVVEKATK